MYWSIRTNAVCMIRVDLKSVRRCRRLSPGGLRRYEGTCSPRSSVPRAFGGGSWGPVPRHPAGRDAFGLGVHRLKTAVFDGTRDVKINTFSLCQEWGGSSARAAHGRSPAPTATDRGFMQKVVRTSLAR